MNRRQFYVLVAVTAMAGLFGGAASERLFSGSQALAAKAAAPKTVAAQEFRLLDPAGATQVRIGFNQEGMATVSWFYRGKDQPSEVGKEQTIVIGNMWGFKPRKAQTPPAAQSPQK
jgi:hypothetical protein